MDSIEKFLKNSLNIEKEAWATAEALDSLASRKSDETQSLMEEYAKDLTHIEEAAILAAKMVQALPEVEMRQIFSARYLHKMTWEETADATFLSLSHVQRLHKKGLAWLQEHYYKSN